MYLKPYVTGFFHDKGVKVNEDLFATSEMLQWLWRSAIREGREITLYIPSSRMRRLLINWLNDIN
ncbi:hypothetical protein BRE01_62450 [Brevibacillus reuszeri]|uniref:Uncharacterized protein n=1 Tax=Brevibacillus reuszeri TaxID=54915 RepID=A0ABQ0U0C7_9BACL|nr:hypothetical protein BRE01_62450 [Brevibacillus reuszeri]